MALISGLVVSENVSYQVRVSMIRWTDEAQFETWVIRVHTNSFRAHFSIKEIVRPNQASNEPRAHHRQPTFAQDHENVMVSKTVTFVGEIER
jgi:hypothetical protein